MRRSSSSSSSPSLKYLAVSAVESAAMSSRSPYRPRGGRNEIHGRGRSMTKEHNHFFQQGGRGAISYQLESQALPANHMPHFNQYQTFNRPSLISKRPFYSHPHPHPRANQNHNLSMQPPFEQNHPIYHTTRPPRHFPTMIGDSHYMSVRDANLHFRNGPRGVFSNQLGFQPSALTPPPHFKQYQPFSSIPHINADQQMNPNLRVNQNQSINRQLSFHQNQPIRQPHRNRMQRPSESIDRVWEYAKPGPPPHCDRFIVLSYNLLADYLAINHWDQLYSHIPNHMLDWNWRKRNIIYELGWWSADIMCFQEVDRFRELEDELKIVGYSGIWKMRTGDAVDGCAIFWRASRFKLLFEESIEFNKLGLRNNVAQICVLESLSRSNTDSPLTSSAGSNKVVICNIHVLFNPRRGEIKLGQVRILLEKARTVSKIWNDAPIVFCGDFNCTPKSPLYNFFTERKLDLTGLARDKVSGQESCVIRPPRQFSGYQGVPSACTSFPPPTGIKGPEIGTNQSDSLSEMQRLNVSDVLGKLSITGKDATESTAPSDQMSNQNCEGTKIGITNEVEPSSFEQSCQCADGSQPDKSSDLEYNLNVSEASEHKYIDSNKDTGHNEDIKAFSVSNDGFCSEHPESVSNASSIEALDEKIGKLSIDDPEEDLNGETKVEKEDYNTFLSELHRTEDDLPSDPVERVDMEKDGSRGDTNLNKIPPDKSFVPGNRYRTFYDPSSWTPVEFETATGNVDCTIMEHPLKLRSTYTEVEDLSQTRDANGEPEVTSYNKCFLGTVDYIWRSEGLQTVRTLAPIPKHAMQWTRGFPTKKWGSDHIALASELAFVKDAPDENTQTPS